MCTLVKGNSQPTVSFSLVTLANTRVPGTVPVLLASRLPYKYDCSPVVRTLCPDTYLLCIGFLASSSATIPVPTWYQGIE